MAEISAKTNIIPTLRNIGLIDSDNKPNQELAKKLRDDSSYAEFCNIVLKKAYPQELIDAFPDTDSSKEGIKSWFMNHTGVGDSASQKLVAFYFAMLEANPNPQKNIKKNDSAKTKVIKNTVNTAKQDSTKKIVSMDSHLHSIQNKNENISKYSPQLNLNIQIHISSDASADQIKCIFENMGKYVYNKDVNE